MVSGYQNGTIAQLLQAIIGQINFDGEPISNIGNILLSILEQTPYDDEPKSVIAELFLKLKDKLEGRAFTPYDDEPKSVIAEILLSILNETEYDKEPTSRIAELLLELKAELESYAEITTSGAIANFTTSVVKPLVNLKAYFEATQEAGTPTPQSPKAISGVSAVSVIHCGSNLWNENWEGGSFDESGNPTISNDKIRTVDFIPCKPNVSYYAKGSGMVLFFYDKNKTFISSITKTNTSFTTPLDAYFIKFRMVTNYGIVYNNDLGINFPSTDTDYHAYNPNSNVTLINLGGTYYGGYVEQDKDGKREFVVTHEIVDLGNLTWRLYTGLHSYWWTDDLKPVIKKASVNTEVMDITCACFAKSASLYISNGTTTSGIAVHTDGAVRIVYPDMPTTQSEVNDLISDIEGNIFAYPLATPIEIDLSQTQAITAFNGVNNVWNDSGDTSVTYLAKIEDNLKSTAKFRAEVKEQKEKAKLEKELKELEEKETIKEPTKKA